MQPSAKAPADSADLLDKSYQEKVAKEKNAFQRELYNPETLCERAPDALGYALKHLNSQMDRDLGCQPWDYVIKKINTKSCPRILSIGTGPCGLELLIAPKLNPGYEFHCLDINEDVLKLGAAKAAEKGFKFVTIVQDANFLTLDGVYDFIIAHASLHHLIRLEHVLDEAHEHLAPNGLFFVMEAVPPNGMLFHPEAKDLTNKLFRILPKRFRMDHRAGGTLVERSRFPERDTSAEGFECVRSQDIMRLVEERFDYVYKWQGNGFARRIVDTVFGLNFNLNNEFDKTLVDTLLAFDDFLVSRGALQPETVFYVLRRRPTEALLPYHTPGQTTAYDNGDPTSRWPAGVAELAAQAGACVQQGDFAGARSLIAQALALAPHDPFLLVTRGSVLGILGDDEGSRLSLIKAALLAPWYAPAHANLGQYWRRQGKTADAESCLLRALQLDPGNAGVRRLLGDIYFEMASYREALYQYRAILETAPGDADVAREAARCLQAIGEYAAASALCVKAGLPPLEAQPNDPTLDAELVSGFTGGANGVHWIGRIARLLIPPAAKPRTLGFRLATPETGGRSRLPLKASIYIDGSPLGDIRFDSEGQSREVNVEFSASPADVAISIVVEESSARAEAPAAPDPKPLLAFSGLCVRPV